MRLFIFIFSLLGLLMQNAQANQELNKLIKQNVQDSEKTYRQIIIKTKKEAYQPKLLIHVRTAEQKRLVESNIEWFNQLKINNIPVEIDSLQQVDYGPFKSDFRFFKAQDAEKAKQLFNVLSKKIPHLIFNDKSSVYQSAKWIQPGYFELWLASDLTHFRTD